ncbi:ATP-binding cassette domain-containing protein [Viridibacillus sp. YIM B01967]|uniref:ATP-binding cassette domain-containing protein n=1 Tax=Viridibacillus soli TaxID=2798301 RepID=A0ABS1H724_9BACL|nr:ATP-binding cassette domain-containing protein [Viridibacillus soli]MBK3495111.1 ATP-binding cassette domain-containing protein [Viridibacillus soli]
MKEILLSARNLCKEYISDGNKNKVLENLNIDVYKGDFTVIMGSSGSGKSTLLYCLINKPRTCNMDVC